MTLHQWRTQQLLSIKHENIRSAEKATTRTTIKGLNKKARLSNHI